MNKTYIFVIVIFLFIISLIAIINQANNCYEDNYLKCIGITSTSYEGIIVEKGEPKKTENVSDFFYVYYDDIIFVFAGKKEKYISGVILSGIEYRFGSARVGIGSTKDEIEKAYYYKKKIKDLPNNTIGYIDGNTWVRFTLNNNSVSKISFSWDA